LSDKSIDKNNPVQGPPQLAGCWERDDISLIDLARRTRFAALSGDVKYYGPIGPIDARHSQSTLAYGLSRKPLPVENGAPLRVRVERQLGYKMLVDSFANMGLGKGGAGKIVATTGSAGSEAGGQPILSSSGLSSGWIDGAACLMKESSARSFSRMT